MLNAQIELRDNEKLEAQQNYEQKKIDIQNLMQRQMDKKDHMEYKVQQLRNELVIL